jgi:two-component system cell cycle response regulator
MSQYSILVVDDEPDNFEVIEALLPQEDYTLHYASRGEEAINSLDKFDLDVILLDVMMPDMDGFEVCKRIKAMTQWQHIPVIMVTALSSKADLSRCLAAGADDFLSKPVNGLELRARVQSMLRIKKQHDRIQSLSKLQRNNIHILENSLNELRLDLAVGFPQELNLPLNNILDNIERLQEKLNTMSPVEVNGALELIHQSALKLDKLNQNFLFYLQLALAQKDAKKHQICAPKILIEQIAAAQAAKMKSSPRFQFDLDDAELAVTPAHIQYVITELLDRALNAYNPEFSIDIHGRIVDDAFHFWIDNGNIEASHNPDAKLSEIIRLNSSASGDRELGIGLKIVKKIVEIYDGLFLLSNTEADGNTVYITLPLAVRRDLSQSLVSL